MLTYKVKYRLPGHLFYKTIKNVVEDDVFAEGRMRFFTTIEDKRFEIPTTAEFSYGKDRLTLINYNIKQQNK
jgi:hypothetical protein